MRNDELDGEVATRDWPMPADRPDLAALNRLTRAWWLICWDTCADFLTGAWLPRPRERK